MQKENSPKEEFTIDKNIPIPSLINPGYSSKYPFKKMEIGDSFFVPCENKKTGSIRTELNLYHMVMSAASHFRNRSNKTGQHHIARIVEESGVRGIRIWRDK